MPLIFEKSTQAQFLIPMAVSLGFGILFSTLVTLLLIPVNYLVFEDIKKLVSRIWNAIKNLYIKPPSKPAKPRVEVRSDF